MWTTRQRFRGTLVLSSCKVPLAVEGMERRAIRNPSLPSLVCSVPRAVSPLSHLRSLNRVHHACRGLHVMASRSIYQRNGYCQTQRNPHIIAIAVSYYIGYVILLFFVFRFAAASSPPHCLQSSLWCTAGRRD